MKYLHNGAALILITLLTFGVFSISSAQNNTDTQPALPISTHPRISIHGTIEAISGNTFIAEHMLVTMEDTTALSDLGVGDEITLKGYLMPDDTFQATHIRLPEVITDSDEQTSPDIPRIEICHSPRGNPENAYALLISEAALDAHLNHGDLLGACENAIDGMIGGEPASAIICPPVEQISPLAESLAYEFGYEASEVQAATCGSRTRFYDLTYALLLEEFSGDSHHTILNRYEAGESWDQILAGYHVTFDDLVANRVIGGSDEDGDGVVDPRNARHQLTICHIPPGYPENAHTITIGQAAVAAHLRHGDTVAACGDAFASGSDAAPIPSLIPVDGVMTAATETGTPGMATLTASSTAARTPTRTPTASATRPPTSTSVPTLTSTSVPPTSTAVPPSATPIPTEVPPTSTSIPTDEPPTNEPPTEVPPTDPPPPTAIPPTEPPPPTAVPPTEPPPPTAAPQTVTICHIPPGNPNSAETMQVSPSEVDGHMAHGDSMGPCPNGQ